MARYKIDRPDSTTVAIELTDVGSEREALLGAFDECQQGRCTCPTDEYEKVAAMTMRPEDDHIEIQLRAKDGASFDTDEITACLDYTTKRSSSSS